MGFGVLSQPGVSCYDHNMMTQTVTGCYYNVMKRYQRLELVEQPMKTRQGSVPPATVGASLLFREH